MTTTTDNRFVVQAVHDLGTALWFGGSVMGIAGVNKSGSDLTTGIDKVRVASSAWSRFQPAQFGGIAATLITGLQLTRSNSQRLALQKGYGSVGALKAALTVAGAGATAYAAYSGAQIGRLAEQAAKNGALEVKDATLPSAGTPPEIKKWQARQRVTQAAVPALAGAVIVCNAWLVQSYRLGSTVKGLLGRILPD
ncbi:hypothetical protein SAMN05660464_0668 [Geodermatophilus dictyosporus]|uniref:Uncharacterized protein n=1 Tax=Geodermatophilus dictyosporus TaxID=1523247 RepID=A0A1I5JDM1_9ACTN|nr:hypothetical protein [Geodermatophilus dictyosporus]SFO70887.1 hypothetical protein SAMN05660464_0668 [Geodermatophilus dictyosporus]